MRKSLADRVGFGHPRKAEGRRFTVPELVAAVGLVISLIIAATAVSIGMARADSLGIVADDGGALALAAVFGLIMVTMGGLTTLAIAASTHRRP
jgi:hypothetical protein